ncbi:MAG: bifunctional phosphoglucose/phosphomannose isomerase [Chitinophagaceae bacterium]|nr:bifunctional phosphoglucose/phosphomannose isomerase [Chitinophagaceae bacterium]
MKELVTNFPSQISEAIQIGKSASIQFKNKKFNKVFVVGLGGSGIGGSIVKNYCDPLLTIPFIVEKDYFISNCVDRETLFIACSYSGNTEETLSAIRTAKKNNAQIICITSGGELEKYASKNKIPCILIPSGMPPRACLGYSMVQILFVLKYAELIKKNIDSELKSSLDLIKKEEKNIHKQAKKIAQFAFQKNILLYTLSEYEGLVVRYKQQLNENAKVLAWHNVIPEMTHNEIVGWKLPQKDMAVQFCYHKQDFEKNLRRLNYLKKVVKKHTNHVQDIVLKGNSYWEKAIYFINLTDWVSVYLADLYGHDAVEVKVIDGLKLEMSKK